MHFSEPADEVMNATSSLVLPGYMDANEKSIIKSFLQLFRSLDGTWTKCRKQFALNCFLWVDGWWDRVLYEAQGTQALDSATAKFSPHSMDSVL